MKYGLAGLGCWIDGAYGNDHAIRKMSTMLSDNCLTCNELYKELDSLTPDCEWVSETFDEVVDHLNREHVRNRVYFEWADGDLVLFGRSESD